MEPNPNQWLCEVQQAIVRIGSIGPWSFADKHLSY